VVVWARRRAWRACLPSRLRNAAAGRASHPYAVPSEEAYEQSQDVQRQRNKRDLDGISTYLGAHDRHLCEPPPPGQPPTPMCLVSPLSSSCYKSLHTHALVATASKLPLHTLTVLPAAGPSRRHSRVPHSFPISRTCGPLRAHHDDIRRKKERTIQTHKLRRTPCRISPNNQASREGYIIARDAVKER
jgi:hypothetical protein